MREEFKNSDLWHKRFLPHYNASDKFQMITYRLADSIPQTFLKNLLGAPHSNAGNGLKAGGPPALPGIVNRPWRQVVRRTLQK